MSFPKKESYLNQVKLMHSLKEFRDEFKITCFYLIIKRTR